MLFTKKSIRITQIQMMNRKTLNKMRKDYTTCSDTEIEGIYLLEKLKKDTITTSELMRLQFLTQTITAKEYAIFLEIEEESKKFKDEDNADEDEDACNELYFEDLESLKKEFL